jgi:hypothetical protein
MNGLYSHKSLVGKMFEINNQCWDLFLKAQDTMILNRAIYWMEQTFKQNPKDLTYDQGLDTYANLLYKAGRKEEALKWEQKAILISPNDVGIKSAWEKMNKGLPTWTEQ